MEEFLEKKIWKKFKLIEFFSIIIKLDVLNKHFLIKAP